VLLDRGADANRGTRAEGVTSLWLASANNQFGAVRLLLERGCRFDQPFYGMTPHAAARHFGYPAMAAWLARITAVGWASYLSEPRYALAVLRELTARGRARRERTFHGKEYVLDLLFPDGRPNTRANRDQPRLPDELFAIIARYYGAVVCRPRMRPWSPPSPRRTRRPTSLITRAGT